MLDGAPIVGIATLGSRNRKTGSMTQTWILRADVAPHAASRAGWDRSVCGECPHMGQHDANGWRVEGSRTCYVNLVGVVGLWEHWRGGGYRDLTQDLGAAAEVVAGVLFGLDRTVTRRRYRMVCG